MAPRPSVAPRAPSAGPHTTPVDPALIKRLKSDALAEHFRFAPETFAKGGMDLANRTMYTATAKVEQSLQKLVEEGVEGFNEDEVQRGVYRLETLLEDAIDTQFDLFEIYVLRNTFTFKDELLPYLALPHHEHLDPSLRNADQPALDAYEAELAAYEAELQAERELAAAELFLQAKVARARETAELVGYLKPPGKLDPSSPPSSTAHLLSTQLTALQSRLTELLSTPAPPPFSSAPASGAGSESVAPWAASRSEFVNWAAAAKAAPAAVAGGAGGRGAEDATVERLRGVADETGTARDAKALLGLAGKGK
ncbi:Mis12 protein-domain-containing protein [Rhodotorula diobovata]|uniref:Mis12 protein-domain-containing protein n=1 Tax=Rhodotorula diobovata TaxID=5288 RepID=A0A5C5FM97_9BASI|nr:Mis12 protein-domain-containing protein [Rhodotorula diobovata]